MPDDPVVYRIRDWEETFLTPKTRNREGRLKTVQIPVKLEDVDYIELAGEKGGASTLGVWLALVELAGTRRVRDGRIARSDGRPMTIAEISKVTRIGESELRKGMNRLIAVGWLLSEPFGTMENDSAIAPLSLGEGSLGESRGGEKRADARGERSEEVEAVVAHYRSYHPRANPGDKERSKIRARLKDGYSVADIQAAIDGCHRTPHNIGMNDRGQKYLGLELIVRDSSNVQRFMEAPENPRMIGRADERSIRNQMAGQRWLEQSKEGNGDARGRPPRVSDGDA